MNLFTKQKRTHRHRKKLTVHQGKKQGREFGINGYTLLCLKQINNRDLPYSIGNYTQYLVITCNGKESGKEEILYMCVCKRITLLYT